MCRNCSGADAGALDNCLAACGLSSKVSVVSAATWGGFDRVDQSGLLALVETGTHDACSSQTSCCVEFSVMTPGYVGDLACQFEYAAQDSHLTIAVDPALNMTLQRVSAIHLDLFFAIFDVSFDPPLPNVESVIFREDQAGYLAGIIAGMVVTNSAVVGISAGPAIPTVLKYVNGFQNGVSSVCSTCTFAVQFADAATGFTNGGDGGIVQVQQVLAAGAELVFGAGGATGSAGILYAVSGQGTQVNALVTGTRFTKSEQPVFVVGSDTDEFLTTFNAGSGVSGADRVVTSAIKFVDVGVKAAIGNYLVGNAAGRVVEMDLANGGVGFAPCHDACSVNNINAAAAAATVAQGELGQNVVNTGVNMMTGDMVTELGRRQLQGTPASPAPPPPPAATTCDGVFCGGGVCNAGYCICLDGSTWLAAHGATCPPAAAEIDLCMSGTAAEVSCGQHGVCDSRTGGCACTDGWMGDGCTTPPSLCTISDRLRASGLTEVDETTGDFTLLSARLLSSSLFAPILTPPMGAGANFSTRMSVPNMAALSSFSTCLSDLDVMESSVGTLCLDNANIVSGAACPAESDLVRAVDYCAGTSADICSVAHRVTLLAPTPESPATTVGGLLISGARDACRTTENRQAQCCLEVNFPQSATVASDFACELQYAMADSNLTIGVGVQQGEALALIARYNPTQFFAIIDFAFNPPLPNVESVLFREDQAGYMAGIVAGQVVSRILGTVRRPETFKLGVSAGPRTPSTNRYVAGFQNGVRFECRGCSVVTAFAEATGAGFSNTGGGGLVQAQHLLSQNIQILFGVGGATGSASILYASAAPYATITTTAVGNGMTFTKGAEPSVYVVGADVDEYFTTFNNGQDPGAAMIITSAIKRMDVAVKNSIGNFLVGNALGRNLVMDVVNDGVGYTGCNDACQSRGGPVSQSMMDNAADIMRLLRSGAIVTGV